MKRDANMSKKIHKSDMKRITDLDLLTYFKNYESSKKTCG